jgi:hypothetical protein
MPFFIITRLYSSFYQKRENKFNFYFFFIIIIIIKLNKYLFSQFNLIIKLKILFVFKLKYNNKET